MGNSPSVSVFDGHVIPVLTNSILVQWQCYNRKQLPGVGKVLVSRV